MKKARKSRKLQAGILLALSMLFLAGCAENAGEGISGEEGYQMITAEEAKELMDTQEDYVILDVRTQEEYDAGHIPGAILIPDYEIKSRAEEILTDKEQLILVYCRSGNRSKKAAAQLENLGYTNIKEFGGIKDWLYEVE